MSRYSFWKDAVWWCSCGLYALNRWGIKPHTHNAFFRGHFNDLLLIPCALPLMLQLQQWLGLRKRVTAPEWSEIWFHLAIWSILFEVIGPHLMKTTGDWMDVVAYTIGAIAAGMWWQRHRWIGVPHEL